MFSSFSNEKFEDEFDDIEIINGKLIKKENFKKEEKRENESIKETKKILSEEKTIFKNEKETKIYEDILKKKKLKK